LKRGDSKGCKRKKQRKKGKKLTKREINRIAKKYADDEDFWENLA